jgi:hypothetical protein
MEKLQWKLLTKQIKMLRDHAEKQLPKGKVLSRRDLFA